MGQPPAVLSQLLDDGRIPAGSPAVSDPDQVVTYGELRERTDRLSGVLRERGVRRGDRVGVHLESSVETMVAVHAILRAGAVLVPLDPRGPSEYVASLLRDCAVSVVVGGGSQRRLAAVATASDLRTVVGPDEVPAGLDAVSWSQVAEAPVASPAVPDEHEAAYVIYTSGSTGRPKGIVHTHRSGLAYARLAAAAYGLGPDDVVTTLSPLHFDQSTFSLYAVPLGGARAVMVPDAVLRFPASLTQLVQDHQVTVWYSVPTLLGQVLRRGVLDERDLSALRWVLYGGEPFAPGILAELMGRLPETRFSNVYGPAEVNQCTFHHLDSPPAGDEPVPIGRAWADTEVLVVDDRQEAAGVDEVGEIIVRTVTAMEGYWNQPEATAGAFRHRDDESGEEARWYATGDLGRRRSDGELVFVGRLDNQVKIRGHRVELEAVDAALSRLDGVEAAVTTVRSREDGTVELVALFVGPGAPEPPDLRRRMARSLPSYAVPDELIEQEELPRTPTGKIDRSAVTARLTDARSTGLGSLADD